ncbi:hypothetical protein GT354_29525 [Streptomyces sp. SID3343]|nr:hypothetical protein [Streptomyces sp. SID3343]
MPLTPAPHKAAYPSTPPGRTPLATESVLRGNSVPVPTAMVHPERALRFVVAFPDDPGAARVVTAGQAIAAIRAAFGHRMPRRPYSPGGGRHRATPVALHSLHRPGREPTSLGTRRIPPPPVGWRPFGRTGARVITTWQTPG